MLINPLLNGVGYFAVQLLQVSDCVHVLIKNTKLKKQYTKYNDLNPSVWTPYHTNNIFLLV